MSTINGAITDIINTTDVMQVGVYTDLPENLKIQDVSYGNRGYALALTEALGMTGETVALIAITIVEALKIAQSEVVNQYSNMSIADVINLNDKIIVALPASLTEGLGLSEAFVVQRAIAVIEALGLTDTLGATTAYHSTILEQIKLGDTLARFLGADLVEALGLSETYSGIASRTGTISEVLNISETFTPQFILRVDIAENIGIDDQLLVKGIFQGAVVEGINISAAYIAPNGSVTTWAMNTRTAAVTEYQDYNFNSFARTGHKYLAASRNGLYELLGDDDDGMDIIATIKSGLAQFTGTHLGRFKAAYLATRGGGDFVLRIISGDGSTYNYAVNSESMRSTRVHIGKGLRARYFAFELISTGQDFTLDTLEFIPIVNDRRV